METLINLKPSELNISMIDILKKMAEAGEVTDITILLNRREKRKKYTKKKYKVELNAAIAHIENGENLVSFSWDEFEALSNSLLRK